MVIFFTLLPNCYSFAACNLDSNSAFSKDTINYTSFLDNHYRYSPVKKNQIQSNLQLLGKIINDTVICYENSEIIKFLLNNYSPEEAASLLQLDNIIRFDLVPENLLEDLKSYFEYEYIKPYTEKKLAEAYEKAIYISELKIENEDYWNTSAVNVYPANNISNDSVIKLRLVNDFDDFHKPGDGRVSSHFGWRRSGWHNGIDLAVYHWLPIYAAFPGVVRFARSFGGFGRLIIIRHDNGLETYYAHLSRIKVRPGQRVEAGDVIGSSGNSGRSKGTHLHFEVRYQGTPINPAHIICFRNYELRYEEVYLKKQDRNFFVYAENAILYKVQKGDYLHKIAREFGTSVSRICDTNNINRRSTLRVGQVIKIYM